MPVNPAAHVHLYPLISSLQEPPLTHGLDEQSVKKDISFLVT